MTRTAVYRHFDADGRLLYIGCSHDPLYRFMGHKSASSWAHEVANISVQWFDDREAALEAERKAIMTDRPAHNAIPGERQYKPWPANQGHVLLCEWVRDYGFSVEDFAFRMGMPVRAAREYFNRVRHPRVPVRMNICIATDGCVPLRGWDRHACAIYRRRFVPVVGLSRGSCAESNLKHALDCVAQWAKRGTSLSPYASFLLSQRDAA